MHNKFFFDILTSNKCLWWGHKMTKVVNAPWKYCPASKLWHVAEAKGVLAKGFALILSLVCCLWISLKFFVDLPDSLEIFCLSEVKSVKLLKILLTFISLLNLPNVYVQVQECFSDFLKCSYMQSILANVLLNPTFNKKEYVRRI